MEKNPIEYPIERLRKMAKKEVVKCIHKLVPFLPIPDVYFEELQNWFVRIQKQLPVETARLLQENATSAPAVPP